MKLYPGVAITGNTTALVDDIEVEDEASMSGSLAVGSFTDIAWLLTQC